MQRSNPGQFINTGRVESEERRLNERLSVDAHGRTALIESVGRWAASIYGDAEERGPRNTCATRTTLLELEAH